MDYRNFGLTSNPFRAAPGSTFYYTSLNHRRILDSLLNGFRERVGVHLVLGENGAGKTTLCRYVQMAYNHEFDIAFVGNPFLTEHEFLGEILKEYGLEVPQGATISAMLDALTAYLERLHAENRIAVLFIDEAHALDTPLFDLVLLLANRQRHGQPLVQIVLCGLPEILDRIASPRLASVNQRIGSRHGLVPLDHEDTVEYVTFRLRKAGARHEVFEEPALRLVHRASGGVPRLINHICRLAMDQASLAGERTVSRARVAEVLQDPNYATLFRETGQPARRKGRRNRFRRTIAAAAVALFALVVATAVYIGRDGVPPQEVAVEQTAQAPSPPQTPEPPEPAASPSEEAVAEEIVDELIAEDTRGDAAEEVFAGIELDTGLDGDVAQELTSDTTEQTPEPVAEPAPEQPSGPIFLGDARSAADEPEPQAPEDEIVPDEVFAEQLIAEAEPEFEPEQEVFIEVEPEVPVAGTEAEEFAAMAEIRDELTRQEAARRDAAETVLGENGQDLAEQPEQPYTDPVDELAPVAESEGIRLSAVAWSSEPGRRLAVMNQTIVHEGDTFRDALVESIGRDHVVLLRNGERRVVRMAKTQSQ